MNGYLWLITLCISALIIWAAFSQIHDPREIHKRNNYWRGKND